MPPPTGFQAGSRLPRVIQGGMGVGVSHYGLARAVALTGEMGVVSGTAIDMLLARRLQDGDLSGEMRRALALFPVAEMTDKVLDRYFLAQGRNGRPYRGVPMHSHRDKQASQDLLVIAAFVEVTLAKCGHTGCIGINLLTKVQIPTVATLFGAMLADVDCVLMGAGIPREIPGILDRLAALQSVESHLDVIGAPGTAPVLRFDPSRFGVTGTLRRPAFVPIVASHTLATVLARKASGSVEGFIVEGPTAGGHNAPPRGAPVYDALGQPVYGERDNANIAAIASLGLPYWLAGGMDTPARVAAAIAGGAAGVQVGTLFAWCGDSGTEPTVRKALLDTVRAGAEFVLTSSRASSTGYPFKVASVPGTLSEPSVYARRVRKCDLGYLREAYRDPRGGIGYRCAAEPIAEYVAKGGENDDTTERRCLCNGLASTVGFGQLRDGGVEPALVTSGDGLQAVRTLLGDWDSYSAADVVRYLLPDGGPSASPAR